VHGLLAVVFTPQPFAARGIAPPRLSPKCTKFLKINMVYGSSSIVVYGRLEVICNSIKYIISVTYYRHVYSSL